MSKSKHSKKQDYNYDDEYEDSYNSRESKPDKRKQRRIDHALRTKNVQELMDYEDDLS